MRENFVWNRGFLQRNTHHVATSGFTALADSIGDFAGLAQTDTDAAFFVTHNDKRAEIETPATFDDFGGTVDENDLFDQFLAALALETGFRIGRLAPAAWTTTTFTPIAAAFVALRRLLLLLLRRLRLLFRATIYIIVFVSHNIFSLLFC